MHSAVPALTVRLPLNKRSLHYRNVLTWYYSTMLRGGKSIFKSYEATEINCLQKLGLVQAKKRFEQTIFNNLQRNLLIVKLKYIYIKPFCCENILVTLPYNITVKLYCITNVHDIIFVWLIKEPVKEQGKLGICCWYCCLKRHKKPQIPLANI